MVAALKPETPMLVTTHLHMTRRSAFRPAYINGNHFAIEQMDTSDISFYRFLYKSVGEMWCWRERKRHPARVQHQGCDPG